MFLILAASNVVEAIFGANVAIWTLFIELAVTQLLVFILMMSNRVLERDNDAMHKAAMDFLKAGRQYQDHYGVAPVIDFRRGSDE